MGQMKALLLSLALLVAHCLAAVPPSLNIDGFSWAENLAFDGLGGLFVSESVRGELWRISLDEAGSSYAAQIHLAAGFKQFGGLAPSPNGEQLYAAAKLKDGSFAIVCTSTKPALANAREQSYSIVASNMTTLHNGMALVPSENAIYGTAESGTLTRTDVASGVSTIISDSLAKPDGLWYDEKSHLLFVGELVSKRMKVYDLSIGQFSDFDGLSSLDKVHMLDDLTVVADVDKANLGKTLLVGADWTGRKIMKFTLDGSYIESVAPPAGVSSFYEPTSVRRGRGPGFDANSFYITEGGGLTSLVKDRRVLQLAPGSI